MSDHGEEETRARRLGGEGARKSRQRRGPRAGDDQHARTTASAMSSSSFGECGKPATASSTSMALNYEVIRAEGADDHNDTQADSSGADAAGPSIHRINLAFNALSKLIPHTGHLKVNAEHDSRPPFLNTFTHTHTHTFTHTHTRTHTHTIPTLSVLLWLVQLLVFSSLPPPPHHFSHNCGFWFWLWLLCVRVLVVVSFCVALLV